MLELTGPQVSFLAKNELDIRVCTQNITPHGKVEVASQVALRLPSRFACHSRSASDDRCVRQHTCINHQTRLLIGCENGEILLCTSMGGLRIVDSGLRPLAYLCWHGDGGVFASASFAIDCLI